MVFLGGGDFVQGFIVVLSFDYIICIAIGDPVIKMGLDPRNRFNPSAFLCLFQTGNWISKVFSYFQ